MKRSDLKSYIKEQIVSTLEEATFQADKGDQSSIDAAKKSADKDDVIKISEDDAVFTKRNEDADKKAKKLNKAMDGFMRKLKGMDSGEFEETLKQLKKSFPDNEELQNINEIDDDEGDKEATKGARKNASKTKRLDAKIKAKRDIEAQMKSALNAFKKADTDESKETAKIALKKLTALKKEAEAEIKTLEGEII